MSAPPENERSALPGASLTDQNLLLTDNAIVNYSGAKVKAPIGAGYEHDGELVPIVLPSIWNELTRPKQECVAISIALEAITWTSGDKGRLAAYHCLLGNDRRPVHDVAQTAGCSSSKFYRALKELKALIIEWRSEFTSEVSS